MSRAGAVSAWGEEWWTNTERHKAPHVNCSGPSYSYLHHIADLARCFPRGITAVCIPAGQGILERVQLLGDKPGQTRGYLTAGEGEGVRPLRNFP